MQKPKQWFALPLEPHHRFMAAFRVTSLRMPVNPLTLLYALVYKPTEGDLQREGVFAPAMIFTGDSISAIRNYFFDNYEQEEALVHYLNKAITTKYFLRPKKSTHRARTRKDDKVIEENVNNLLTAVFENLKL